MAAQVVTFDRTTRQWGDDARLSIITLTCTTATGGTISYEIPNLDGWLMKVITNPGATAPTDDYDITLVDELGVDAAASLLLNRDTTNTEMVTTFVSGAPTPLFLAGTHTFTVANAGDAKNFVCTMYLLDEI